MADEKKFSPRMAKAGFGLYLLFCLVLFVLVRFPYDTFRGRLEETMSSLIGRPVALGHISSSLPFGLKVEGVSIGENPFAKELKIRPGLISLLTGSLDLDMEAFFPSGSLSGRVRTPLGTMGESLIVSARMDGLDSQAFQSLFPSGVQPRGIVSGTIDLSRPNASPREMEGRADIIWKDGYLPIPHSQLNLPLPLDGIQFTTLKVESVVEKGLVTLENIEWPVISREHQGNDPDHFLPVPVESDRKVGLPDLASRPQAARPLMDALQPQGHPGWPRFRLLNR